MQIYMLYSEDFVRYNEAHSVSSRNKQGETNMVIMHTQFETF